LKQISNKTLGLLLIAAIVISIGGTIINVYRIRTQVTRPAEIIGMATDGTGTATVTIESLVGITVVNDIDFGTGFTNGSINITLATETNHSNFGTWNNCSWTVNDTAQGASCKGLNIENTGQRHINVTMTVDVNKTGFFEGANASANFTFAVVNGTVNKTGGGCMNTGDPNDVSVPMTYGNSYVNSTSLSVFNWSSDMITGNTYLLCELLDHATGNDTITLEMNITIPSDESDQATGTEVRTATFTISAAQKGT